MGFLPEWITRVTAVDAKGILPLLDSQVIYVI